MPLCVVHPRRTIARNARPRQSSASAPWRQAAKRFRAPQNRAIIGGTQE
jgi:hypothetical protein